MILDILEAASKKRVEAAKNILPLQEMMALAAMQSIRPSFQKALEQPGMSFICEVKKASPSKGLIAPDFPYLDIAREYEEAGACAISVLTEPDYFLGSSRYLTEISQVVGLPLLRKDFTVDPYQIYEAKAIGASAVLLICALLPEPVLKEYLQLCEDLKLDALVEAHDEAEIRTAIHAGAKIIGVNNRNLKTFQVDFSNSLQMRDLIPPSTLFIAESGVQTTDDLLALGKAKADGILIGETIMRSSCKKELLHSWKQALADSTTIEKR